MRLHLHRRLQHPPKSPAPRRQRSVQPNCKTPPPIPTTDQLHRAPLHYPSRALSSLRTVALHLFMRRSSRCRAWRSHPPGYQRRSTPNSLARTATGLRCRSRLAATLAQMEEPVDGRGAVVYLYLSGDDQDFSGLYHRSSPPIAKPESHQLAARHTHVNDNVCVLLNEHQCDFGAGKARSPVDFSREKNCSCDLTFCSLHQPRSQTMSRKDRKFRNQHPDRSRSRVFS